MKILCVFGQHNYGDPRRGEGYEYANFIPALRRLGHEVLFFESWNRQRFHNFRELNETLLHTVEQNRPDVVFSLLFLYEIWLESWEILRDSGITATINWATDDSWRYAQFSQLVAPFFHAFTTTYPSIYDRYHKDGIHHVLLTQWGADADKLQPPLSGDQCKYSISFIGTAHGKRKAWVKALNQHGIEVACFGYGWPRGTVSSNQIPQIVRHSVINLNFANSVLTWDGIFPRRANQVKARTFEVPGAGGFLLTEWADGLDRYYIPGREVAVFHSLKELAERIHHYLKHPAERDAIAWAGYERTRKEHTYDKRLSEVLDFVLRRREEYFSQKGVSPTYRIDWERFEEAAQHHKMDQKLRYLKHVLVRLCSMLWGPVRGPRAARRFVFELSWRFARSHTYSAAGWPGRMFYEVS